MDLELFNLYHETKLDTCNEWGTYAFVKTRRILELDHLHLLHYFLLEVLVAVRDVITELLIRSIHVHSESRRRLL